MTATRIAAAFALVALLPSVARAQTLTACYVPKSGTVYRIKVDGAPTKCAQNHVEFTWSATGTPGPQGPQGETGPQGPAGPAGNTGLEIVQRAQREIDPGQSQTVDVTCPTGGKVAIGGGFAMGGGSNGINVHSSEPLADGSWRFYVSNSAATSLQFRAYVLCINP